MCVYVCEHLLKVKFFYTPEVKNLFSSTLPCNNASNVKPSPSLTFSIDEALVAFQRELRFFHEIKILLIISDGISLGFRWKLRDLQVGDLNIASSVL